VKMVVADRLCEAGRYGQKTGAGFYRYEPGNRNALHDPEVDKVVDEVRAELGITPRKISNQEIVERCVYALVNEGAQILDEGIAQRASDIDMVYLTGYGFPVFRGGPMHYAEEWGCRTWFALCRPLPRTVTPSLVSGNRRPCWPSVPKKAKVSTPNNRSTNTLGAPCPY